MQASNPTEPRWLLLIHQIPPEPAYLRVKVWRRLQRIGAVAVKNSVYVLPRSDQAQEDFEWTVRQIVQEGGEASICEARFIEGITDGQVEALFQEAREADYRAIADQARRLISQVSGRARRGKDGPASEASALLRLKRRVSEVAAIDFFGAPGREIVHGLVTAIEDRLQTTAADKEPGTEAGATAGKPRGRTWVTRRGIHVDRMASAWLIRRFIDPEARFKFVPAKGYRSEEGELRFDMFEAELTHEGDRCTIEVLMERFRLKEPGLRPIAEIVHDIDLRDSKFERPETAGVERVITGIAAAHRDDEGRLVRSAALFDDLYESFRRKGR